MRDNISKGAFMLEGAKCELNEVDEYHGCWGPIELTVDNGAADTVTPPGS